jgi:DNA-binding HxlR family transcriptional regulator
MSVNNSKGNVTVAAATLGTVQDLSRNDDEVVDHAHTPVEACPSFLRAMAIVGKRWNGLIIQAMAKGCTSFTEISTFAEKLSDASLARRLKELEEDGLIIRSVLDERPVKVRYSLTEAGAALAPVLDMLTSWGEQYAVAPKEG